MYSHPSEILVGIQTPAGHDIPVSRQLHKGISLDLVHHGIPGQRVGFEPGTIGGNDNYMSIDYEVLGVLTNDA